MYIYQRSILINLLKSYLFFLLGIYILIISVQIIRLETVLTRGGDIFILVKYVFYLTASAICYLLPLCSWFSCLYTYSTLHKTGELHSALSLGYSYSKLTFPIIPTCCAIIIASYVLSWNVMPHVIKTSESILQDKYMKKIYGLIYPLNKIDKNTVIYINSNNKGNMEDIILLNSIKNEDRVLFAKEATLQNNTIILKHGYDTTYKDKKESYKVLFEDAKVTLNIDLNFFNSAEFFGFVESIMLLKKEFSPKVFMLFLQKIIWPLYSIVFMMLSVFFVLKSYSYLKLNLICFFLAIMNFLCFNLGLKHIFISYIYILTFLFVIIYIIFLIKKNSKICLKT